MSMEGKNVIGGESVDEKNVTPNLGDTRTLIGEKKVIPISEIWIDLRPYFDPVSVKEESCVTSVDEINQTPNSVNTVIKNCFTCRKYMDSDRIYSYNNECRNKEMEADEEVEKPKEEVERVYDNTNSRKRKNYKPMRFRKDVVKAKVCSDECSRVDG